MPSRRRRYRARPKPQVPRPPANDDLLRLTEVRVVGAEGQQLGVLPPAEALRLAHEAGSDLVMVASKAVPPVVRILDLGKHMYDQRKKLSKQKAKSKGGEIKGVRLGFKIGQHDQEIRLRQADMFLNEGHKVRVEMRLHGREKGRGQMAAQKIRDFVTLIPSGAILEGGVSFTHNSVSTIVTRGKAATPATPAPQKLGEAGPVKPAV